MNFEEIVIVTCQDSSPLRSIKKVFTRSLFRTTC